ncbi:MAG TPA: TIR domain-containing protein [Propionibacteriaceae bacterium]|nr:TIR domain-containing protein [Propionibacteriaceae bacterium]
MDAQPARYRRQEASHLAGRIADRLVDKFGRAHVFMDIDSIAPGRDFGEAIEDALSECAVLLVLIGPTWVGALDARGRRRLDDPDDLVVLEIQAALDRAIPVIPVLADGAEAPTRDDLPERLIALARRQAVRIDHETFSTDCAALLQHVTRIVTEASPPPALEAEYQDDTDVADTSGDAERVPNHLPGPARDVEPAETNIAKTEAEPANSRWGRVSLTAGVGALVSLLGLPLSEAFPFWIPGQLALVIGIIMLVISGSRRRHKARRDGTGTAPERWHWGLATASLALAGLGVAGMELLRGPAIGSFATNAAWIIFLVVGIAAFLTKGWIAFDALHLWRQVVVVLVAALVVPALYFAAIWTLWKNCPETGLLEVTCLI